jgi:hypothetical protein
MNDSWYELLKGSGSWFWTSFIPIEGVKAPMWRYWSDELGTLVPRKPSNT